MEVKPNETKNKNKNKTKYINVYDLWNTKFLQKFPSVVKIIKLVFELMITNNVKIYINVNK